MIEKYINRIILGDCLDVLRALPSNSIDAVITDPPYCSGGRSIASRQKKTNAKYENNPTGRPDFEGDAKDSRSWLAWCSLWMSECYRVLKEGGIFSRFAIGVCFQRLRMQSKSVAYHGEELLHGIKGREAGHHTRGISAINASL